MSIFKEITGRIWALWMLLLFVSTMFIFFIPFFLWCYFEKEPRKTYRFISFSRVWMGIFLTMTGCPLKVKGREHFLSGKNYIVLCNHRSFMDIPVSSPAIPGGNKTIAKIEIARVPLFGLLYKTGSVIVDRKSEGSRKDSYRKMKEVLAMGLHMCIYPEGTRNKSSEPLNAFHSGAFRLATDTQKAIIPALIFNTEKVLPSGKIFYTMPYRLQIHFLPAVEVIGHTAETLKEKVHEIMKLYYLQNQ